MKLKNNSKKVEKNYSCSVVNVALVVEHNLDERGVYVRLVSKYRIAYTDDDSLSKFISLIKKDPLKHYKSRFFFNAPITTRVFVNPVSMDNYRFGKCSNRRGYLILSECTDLHIHDLFKHNRNLVQYQPQLY